MLLEPSDHEEFISSLIDEDIGFSINTQNSKLY